MRNAISMLFYICGGLACIAAGLYGVYLSFSVVFSVFPSWMAYLSLLFFPFVYGIAPFYAGLALGLDFIFVSYLGLIPGGILIWIGTFIEGKNNNGYI